MQESKFKYLNLSKQNMKFSAAHFLIFDETHAERLHGHNYQVQVRLKIPWSEQNELGYGVDFGVLKKILKEKLDQWDEYVLLPAKHKDSKSQVQGESLEVRFRERRYVFPQNEVILLPIVNTSVELLSELLGEVLWVEFSKLGLLAMCVQVEETAGQSAQSIFGDW